MEKRGTWGLDEKKEEVAFWLALGFLIIIINGLQKFKFIGALFLSG